MDGEATRLRLLTESMPNMKVPLHGIQLFEPIEWASRMSLRALPMMQDPFNASSKSAIDLSIIPGLLGYLNVTVSRLILGWYSLLEEFVIPWHRMFLNI